MTPKASAIIADDSTVICTIDIIQKILNSGLPMNTHSDKITLTAFYLGSFVIYYLITLMITLFPDFLVLRTSGLLVPVICLFEFAVIYPLYRFYCQRRDDIPFGQLSLVPTLLFTAALLILMLAETQYLLPEVWLSEQASQARSSQLILLITAVCLAPVFEEVLFRGFLLQAFLLWAPESRLACTLLTSLLFAAMHTQYVHWQSIVALTLFSLLLCWARMKSKGLALPVFLHTLNNLIALVPALYLSAF